VQEYLSVTAMAERLGCSRSTGYDLVARKLVPSIKLGPRTIRIRADSLDEALKALEQPATLPRSRS